MSSIQFVLSILLIAVLELCVGLFYLRPKAKLSSDPGAKKRWKWLVFGALLLLIAGTLALVLPARLWWPAY